MKKNRIIFDVDDTIIHTSETAFIKAQEVADILGLQHPSFEHYFSVYGRFSFNDCVRELHPGINPLEYKKIYDSLKNKYPYKPIGNPGKIFEQLFKCGFEIGILSNGEGKKIEEKLLAAGIINGIREKLSFILHAENLLYLKPDHRCFDQTDTHFDEPRDKWIYVGDCLADLRASTNAGIEFIGVLSGFTEKDAFINNGVNQKQLLRDIMEIPEAIIK